jgi:chemotaxis protein methyltransferase CheR
MLGSALEQIAALVTRESGIVLRDVQFDAFAAAVERVDPDGDADRLLRRVAHPVEGQALLARLLDEVTVKETFFLREPDQLRTIAWKSLFERARASATRTARIWSAGCATGEEAYSLALLACESFGSFEPPVTVLATDISQAALARARAGEYRPRSTRALSPALRGRYFREDGDRLVVGDALRALVSFRPHNLSLDAVPPDGEAPFDLILCRNVLIYFDAATAKRVSAALTDALAPAGGLILGAADSLSRASGRLSAPVRSVGKTPPPADRQRSAPADSARHAHQPPPPTAAELSRPDVEASAFFLDGLAKLETGDPAGAVGLFRRALYAEPRLGLAAFQLARAFESLGDRKAARRAYAQAIRTCSKGGELDERLLEQIDLEDVIAAANARLAALARGID